MIFVHTAFGGSRNIQGAGELQGVSREVGRVRGGIGRGEGRSWKGSGEELEGVRGGIGRVRGGVGRGEGRSWKVA